MPFSAYMMEVVMSPLERLRGRTITNASGKVLEIGVGTGLNLPYYGTVEALYAIEPDAALLDVAKQRAKQHHVAVEFIQTGAEELPFPDDFFDSVMVTWVFCTIPEIQRAIREILRVLRPGGALHYIEHTASPHKGMRWMQRWMTPAWKKVAGGCHLNRDPHTLLTEAGFLHDQFRPIQTSFWNPFPIYAGTAHKPA
jgi:ubiquinone/menaquinone biosynthesis C-methylase UbiE